MKTPEKYTYSFFWGRAEYTPKWKNPCCLVGWNLGPPSLQSSTLITKLPSNPCCTCAFVSIIMVLSAKKKTSGIGNEVQPGQCRASVHATKTPSPNTPHHVRRFTFLFVEGLQLGYTCTFSHNRVMEPLKISRCHTWNHITMVIIWTTAVLVVPIHAKLPWDFLPIHTVIMTY